MSKRVPLEPATTKPGLWTEPEPRPWRPSLLVWGSLLLHAAMAAAWAARPDLLAWWVALIVLDHLMLTLAGLWPRSALLGPNWRELPDAARAGRAIAITIDDGPDPEVTPRVLDLLARHGAKATFFCIGLRAEVHPELVRRIAAEGHAVESHSYAHRHHFSLFGPRRLYADILAAQSVLRELAGRPPRFFRAPAGLRNPFLEPILARLGLRLASWTRRGFDTRERDPRRVLKRLEAGIAPGAILLLHDGHAARTAAGEPIILAVLPGLLAEIRSAGLRPVTLAEALSWTTRS